MVRDWLCGLFLPMQFAHKLSIILQNRQHSYREAIDAKFGNNVKVLTLEQALTIQKSDIQNNLCIVIASLQAFRRTDKQWLKVFQNNGALLSHFENLVEDTDFLDKDADGQIVYSLGNVIKINNPLVIVDEGHNAQTLLSFEMLRLSTPHLFWNIQQLLDQKVMFW